MRGLALALLAVTPALLGCLGTPAPLPAPGPGMVPELVAPVFDALVVLDRIGGTEPNIRVSPQDHVFVTTTGRHLWRSADGGATFEAVGDPSCTAPVPLPQCTPNYENRESGLEGGGDGAIALDRQGRLHWLGLFGTVGSVPYQYSDDDGLTWSDAVDLAHGNATDREWIAVGADDVVYAVWRDGGAGSGAPFPLSLVAAPGEARPAIMLATSRDRGATWSDPVAILESEPIDGPLVADPARHALYLPYSDAGIHVLRSLDDGATWDTVDVPSRQITGNEDIGIEHFIFPVVGVDAAGTLYAAWSDDADGAMGIPTIVGKNLMVPSVFLAVSKDQGATWSDPRMMSDPASPAVFPAIVGGAPGRIALAWYQATNPTPGETLPNEWDVILAESVDADAAEPTFAQASATPQPIHLGSICTQGTTCSAGDRTRGDFFEVALRPSGQPILAFVQDNLPPGPDARRATVVVARVAEGAPML